MNLVELYWYMGRYISAQLKNKSWGNGTAEEFAANTKKNDLNIKGGIQRNIWAMKQFYETCQPNKKLPTLVAELNQIDNRRLMSLKTIVRPHLF